MLHLDLHHLQHNSSSLQAQWPQFLSPRAWSSLILPLALLRGPAASSTADWHNAGSSAYRPSLRLSLALESHPGVFALGHFRGGTQPQPLPWLQQWEDNMLAAGSALSSAFSSPLAPRTPFCHTLMTAQTWEWRSRHFRLPFPQNCRKQDQSDVEMSSSLASVLKQDTYPRSERHLANLLLSSCDGNLSAFSMLTARHKYRQTRVTFSIADM